VVFARHDLAAPAAVLPSLAAGSTCVRFCPTFFARAQPAGAVSASGKGDSSLAPQLPYRLVFAVGCTDSVLLYDTEHAEPLAVLAALHYKHVTDVAWSADGLRLAVASHDGYCTLATWKPGELGAALPSSEAPDVDALRAEIARAEGQKARVASCLRER